MKIIKRWHSRVFYLADEPLKVKLKSLQKNEAPAFLKGISALNNSNGTAGAAAQDEGKLDLLADQLASLDCDFVRKCFRDYLKPDEPMQNEAGEVITTGEQLYDEATPGFLLGVLFELQHLCVLTVQEGKGSRSRSTSSAGEGTGSSPSAVTSIEGAAGPGPSGATEMTEAEPSSSSPAAG
jgi:hypothetical protein